MKLNQPASPAGIITIDLSVIPPEPKPVKPGRVRALTEADHQPIKPPGEFYALFRLNGKPISPPIALEAVRSGSARFQDLDAAHEAVTALASRARLLGEALRPELRRFDNNFSPTGGGPITPEEYAEAVENEPGPGVREPSYRAVVGAAAAVEALEAALRAAQAAGIVAGSDPIPGEAPKLLTAEETAAVFRISVDTLDRWVADNRIPPPLKIGGRERSHRRWRADVVYNFLWQGIPRDQRELVAS